MRPLRLVDRAGWVIVPPADLTAVTSADRLIEVWTHRGRAGLMTRPSLSRLVERYPLDWLWLSRAAVVRRGAILRVDYRGRASRHRTYLARVAGMADPVPIAVRAWPAVREALGG